MLGQFENQTDVGSVDSSGTCEYDAEQQAYQLTSAGANIWGDHDDFHFVWKRMTGDFIVTTRAEFVGAGVNPHRKLGWMVRTSLDTWSPNVSTGIHGDGLLTLQFRRTQGGPTDEVRLPLTGADVIQLERKGNTYLMSVARYGEPFATVQVDGHRPRRRSLRGPARVARTRSMSSRQVIYRDVRIVVPVHDGFDRQRDPFGSHLELLDIASGHRQIIYSADSCPRGAQLDARWPGSDLQQRRPALSL